MRQRLLAEPGTTVEMTFAAIDDLVGGLPPSARRHRAWWANDTTARHVQGMAWVGAGFAVASVSSDRVEFTRAAPAAAMPGAGDPVATRLTPPPAPPRDESPTDARREPADPPGEGGDAPEQRAAEHLLIAAVGERLGLALRKQRLRVGGASVELDGYCAEPPVLVEAWAHQGRPRPAQKHKVMNDALKLTWVDREVFGTRARKVLAMGDGEAAGHFLGASWMAAALRGLGIEVVVIDLPDAMRAAIAMAQERQYR